MTDIQAHEFRLYVEMGNDAMQDGHDIAQALQRVAAIIETQSWAPGTSEGHSIRDLNGNTVGSWSIKVPDAE